MKPEAIKSPKTKVTSKFQLVFPNSFLCSAIPSKDNGDALLPCCLIFVPYCFCAFPVFFLSSSTCSSVFVLLQSSFSGFILQKRQWVLLPRPVPATAKVQQRENSRCCKKKQRKGTQSVQTAISRGLSIVLQA